jgi:hypothetical protein
VTDFGSIKFDGEAQRISDGISNIASDLAVCINDMRDSREKSLALTKLEEAIMWGNKAVKSDQRLRGRKAND